MPTSSKKNYKFMIFLDSALNFLLYPLPSNPKGVLQMNKFNLYLMAGFIFCALTCPIEGAEASKPATAAASNVNAAQANKTEEKYDIMKRDQMDSTDVFAIQLDDSEIEDEEEINKLEGKEVFPLPQAKK